MKECPVCLKKIKQLNPRHIKKCFPNDKNYRFKYITHNFPEISQEKIHKFYVEEKWSIPMLCNQFSLDIKSICYLLTYYQIPIRTIKETRQLKEYKERFEKTNIDRYGAKNPLSKGTKPFNKKNQTVQDRYGCENVFQRLDIFVEEWGNHRKRSAISSLNKFLYSILKDLNVDFTPEFSIKYKSPDGLTRWKKYDAKVGNLLIEVNGDYWHANPKKYNPSDEFVFPGNNKITALHIWELDKYKKEIAIQNGYSFLDIWESEINQSKDEVIKKVKDHIYRKDFSKI